RRELQEEFHEAGIEVVAALTAYLVERRVDRPWVLVRAVRGQCVEDVADSADPADERYLLACETARVTAAVPRLVVRQRDLLGHLQERHPGAGQDVRADP